jgi:hypothetical protein
VPEAYPLAIVLQDDGMIAFEQRLRGGEICTVVLHHALLPRLISALSTVQECIDRHEPGDGQEG